MTTNVVSDKKIQANHQNAQKSTGPKSKQGKKRAARNAVKHGLLANQIVIRDNDPNENPDDFEQFYRELLNQYKPETPLEQLLIERIAACHWRLRRAYRFEVQAIHELRTDNDPIAQMYSQLTGTKRDPTQYILPSASNLDKLLRYETMIDLALNRAMAQLRRLRQRHHQQPDQETKPPPVPSAFADQED